MARRLVGLAVVLTVILAAITSIIVASAPPNPSEDSDRSMLQIVYGGLYGEEGGPGYAYVMKVDGSNPQPLQFFGSAVYQFDCSGDGYHLAFVVNNSLYTMGVTDVEPYRVNTEISRLEYSSIALSRNGSQVAVLRNETAHKVVIELFDAVSGSLSGKIAISNALSSLGNGIMVFSPDGERILFNQSNYHYYGSDFQSEGDMIEVDLRSFQFRPLSNQGLGPSWSARGNVIAYIRDSQNDHSLTLLDPARDLEVAWIRSGALSDKTLLSPVWSPDGSLIVVNRLDQKIFLIGPDGKPRPVPTTDDQRKINPCFLVERPKALLPFYQRSVNQYF